jgi:hypothetical protein
MPPRRLIAHRLEERRRGGGEEGKRGREEERKRGREEVVGY